MLIFFLKNASKFNVVRRSNYYTNYFLNIHQMKKGEASVFGVFGVFFFFFFFFFLKKVFLKKKAFGFWWV